MRVQQIAKVWAISFVVSVASAILLFDVPQLLILRNNSILATGMVVRRESEHHGNIVVRFAAKYKVYEQSAGPYPYALGQSIPI